MYVHEEKLKNGQSVFRFTYINNNGKRVRLKVKDHPDFKSKEEAVAWAKTQTAHQTAMKAKLEERRAWRNKYYHFDELFKNFKEYYRGKAKYSWESTAGHLENYVFRFFLDELNANNVNLWHLYFSQFKDWLKKQKTLSGKKSTLAMSSQNNIILSLNAFLSYLAEYNLISKESQVKCTAYPDHMLNFRDYNDVIDDKELARVRKKIESTNKDAADFFYVLWNTGMRFNELFSLPITSLFSGKLDGAIDEELKRYNIKYYGYIILESQAVHDDRKRTKAGTIQRKPLKGRKSISPKNARTIPIMDKECWNILARRFKREQERYVSKVYGTDKNNYIFFNDLEWNKAVNSLRCAYEQLSLTPKSYHCCRHSFVTNLIGKTRSFFLVRMITGHKKDTSFERYLHIYEKINQVAKQSSQEIEEVG